MAITYVDGASGMRRGVPNAETNCKVLSVTTRVNDEKHLTKDNAGQTDGYAGNVDPWVELQVTFETGITAAEAAGSSLQSAALNADVASILQNETIHAFTDATPDTYHGIEVTEWFVADVEYTASREAFQTGSMTLWGYPAVTHA